jgi:serine/threonine-protein kinase
MNKDDPFMEACKQIIDINSIKIIKRDELNVRTSKSSLLGKGGQAKIYLGELDGVSVAVKIIKDVDWKSLSHELIIISNISHPNIPKFYGVVLDDKYIELVFQYIDGISLEKYAGKFAELDRLNIVKSVASAIELIFKNSFIHRDLKMENIMIDSKNNEFLIDFGIAKVVNNMVDTKTRAIGSVYYIPPEIFTDEDEEDKDGNLLCTITHKVDVWAFGMIISYLYSGFLPWTNKFKNNEPVIQDCLIKKKAFPIPDNIKDENIIKLIKMSTVVDPNKRSTISEMIAVLDNIK